MAAKKTAAKKTPAKPEAKTEAKPEAAPKAKPAPVKCDQVVAGAGALSVLVGNGRVCVVNSATGERQNIKADLSKPVKVTISQ